ncbi:hypothetical protein [Kitasatospora arboriphila]|uniref:DUF3188 domain-containing protein n=1 Tax=Kitasatospora arboriphila TaxID=258052 RepID=A0ABP4EK54_9ACTN
MNGHFSLEAIVLLLLGGVVTYVAYLHPGVGVALLVGVGVVGLVAVLLKNNGNGGS